MAVVQAPPGWVAYNGTYVSPQYYAALPDYAKQAPAPAPAPAPTTPAWQQQLDAMNSQIAAQAPTYSPAPTGPYLSPTDQQSLQASIAANKAYLASQSQNSSSPSGGSTGIGAPKSPITSALLNPPGMNSTGVGGAVGSAAGAPASTQPTKSAGTGGPPASASEGSSAGSTQPQPNSSGTVGESNQSGSGSSKSTSASDAATPTSGPGSPWAQWGQSSAPLNNAPGATGSTASSSLGRTVLTGGLPYAPGGTMAGVNNQIGDYQSMQKRYAQSYSDMLRQLSSQAGGMPGGSPA